MLVLANAALCIFDPVLTWRSALPALTPLNAAYLSSKLAGVMALVLRGLFPRWGTAAVWCVLIWLPCLQPAVWI